MSDSEGAFSFELINPPQRTFICVLDFEATCEKEPAPPPSPQEIIEFPSILLSRNEKDGSLDEIGRFEAFVRPTAHPKLSAFCTELTSITQENVEEAETFEEVFQRHQEWLRAHGVFEPDTTIMFITCGDWDLSKALPKQMEAIGMSYAGVPKCYKRWINIKKIADDVTGTRHQGMHSLMTRFGLEFEGRQHRGIDDCHNLARVVKLLDEQFEVDWTTPTRENKRFRG